MDLISRKTRIEFKEYLANWTLHRIKNLFEGYDVPFKPLPTEETSPSERRALVDGYYAGIDWKDYKDVKKIVDIYAELLAYIKEDDDFRDPFNPQLKKTHAKMIDLLQKDGFEYDGKQLKRIGPFPVEFTYELADLLDPAQFNEYVERIRISIDEDPALAIGSTKELVESVLKTILSHKGEELDDKDDIPNLLKKVRTSLKLTPDDIDHAAKGADLIKVLLSNLGQVVIKLNELRNLYGTGHGMGRERKGLQPRHAKLAVTAGIAIATFLLDTYKSQSFK